MSYVLDGPGSNPGGDEIFRSLQTGPGAHPASCTMGTGSFPGVKCGRGVLLTTHPLLVPRSWKSRAIPLLTLWATTGPVTGNLYLYILVKNARNDISKRFDVIVLFNTVLNVGNFFLKQNITGQTTSVGRLKKSGGAEGRKFR